MSCLPWPARHGAAKRQRAAFSCQEARLLLGPDVFLRRLPQTLSPTDFTQQAMINRSRPFAACGRARTRLNFCACDELARALGYLFGRLQYLLAPATSLPV